MVKDVKQERKTSLLVGEVLSTTMAKTIVVKTERILAHSVFRKTVKRYKKYKVHDEEGIAKVGDTVEIFIGRPIAKTKFMYLSRVVKSAATV